MNTYAIGDSVYAKLGTLPVVGTVVAQDKATGNSAVQQDWYDGAELTLCRRA